MREDLLRRFGLGITIEDTNMRIWCHDRALLSVSAPVDFTTVWRLVALRGSFLIAII